jgi:hypothetical protein
MWQHQQLSQVLPPHIRKEKTGKIINLDDLAVVLRREQREPLEISYWEIELQGRSTTNVTSAALRKDEIGSLLGCLGRIALRSGQWGM